MAPYRKPVVHLPFDLHDSLSLFSLNWSIIFLVVSRQCCFLCVFSVCTSIYLFLLTGQFSLSLSLSLSLSPADLMMDRWLSSRSIGWRLQRQKERGAQCWRKRRRRRRRRKRKKAGSSSSQNGHHRLPAISQAICHRWQLKLKLRVYKKERKKRSQQRTVVEQKIHIVFKLAQYWQLLPDGTDLQCDLGRLSRNSLRKTYCTHLHGQCGPEGTKKKYCNFLSWLEIC